MSPSYTYRHMHRCWAWQSMQWDDWIAIPAAGLYCPQVMRHSSSHLNYPCSPMTGTRPTLPSLQAMETTCRHASSNPAWPKVQRG